MQEEGRHVRFRAVVAGLQDLARCAASDQWLTLGFDETRPFTTDEARRDGLAIVVSHDGAVRFVANLEGRVVCWEQFLNW